MYTYFIKSNNLIKFGCCKNIKSKIQRYELYNPSCELLCYCKYDVTHKINDYIKKETYKRDIHQSNGWYFLSDYHLNKFIEMYNIKLEKDT